jgi:DNA-binding MarR family transcriptional regulator
MAATRTASTPATEPRWLDETEMRGWRGLVQVIQLLPLALDRQLQREAGVPHAYYMVLAMLSEAPGRSMRMSGLAALTATSQSRLSHSVARLEERGWVERRPCSDDRRGQVAVLTDAGFSALAAAAPGHVAEVRRRVFDRLTDDQVRALADVAQALAAGLLDEVCPTVRTPGDPGASCPSSD